MIYNYYTEYAKEADKVVKDIDRFLLLTSYILKTYQLKSLNDILETGNRIITQTHGNRDIEECIHLCISLNGSIHRFLQHNTDLLREQIRLEQVVKMWRDHEGFPDDEHVRLFVFEAEAQLYLVRVALIYVKRAILQFDRISWE